jgi:hypothetical protein
MSINAHMIAIAEAIPNSVGPSKRDNAKERTNCVAYSTATAAVMTAAPRKIQCLK